MGAESLSRQAGAHDPRSDRNLALGTARQIDHLCEQFERALQAGQPVTIESCLGEYSGLERSALLRELLALEVEYRLRRGQRPTPDDYLLRFEQHQDVVDLVSKEATLRLPSGAERGAGETQTPAKGAAGVAEVPGATAAGDATTVPPFLANHPRYRVLKFLGAGGMGSVFLAEHRVMERLVALKVINPELIARPGVVERFRRETRAAANLGHPNIVAAYDAETAGNAHFLVMEYVPGSDLASALSQQGALPVQHACDYVSQAARGLQHACEHGMVHRDIKPHNLMLTEGGQVKILDFGLTHIVTETMSVDSSTSPGTILGSIDYMAPEQAVDPSAADIRSDIYSLGCTLYFLLAGHPPFPSGSLFQKVKAHAEQAPPEITGVRGDVPSGLAEVLGRMLAKDPAARFQTPLEVVAALAPWTGPAGAQAEAASAARPALSSTSTALATRADLLRRRRLVRWMLALAIAVVLLAGYSLAGRHLHWWPWSRPSAESLHAEANRLYREGQEMLSQRQERQVRRAIGRFQAALELDPDFAPACIGLADAYNILGDYGWDMADDVFPKAQQAAQQAIQLDDSLAKAHLALAFTLNAYDCDWQQAEQQYARALELDPRLAAAHHWYAWFLVQQGQFQQAEDHMAQAQQLQPDDLIIVSNVGKIYYYSHLYDKAEEKCRAALELNPDFRKARCDLVLVLAELKRLTEALEEFRQIKALTEDRRDLTILLAYTYARNGQAREARPLLAQLEELAETRPRKPLAYEIATVYAALHEKDRAFAWLERAFAEHSAWRSYIKVDPRLDDIRADQRFQGLLKLAHFEE